MLSRGLSRLRSRAQAHRALSAQPAQVEQELGFSISELAREGQPAYLDVQATSPMDPRVLDAMLPYMIGRFGNAHSKTHAYGWDAETATEVARAQVGSLIGADAKEIVFTSGATESNNLAIKGAAHFYAPKKKHIITTQTEHKCVLDSCRQLETEGFEVTYLPVGRQTGLVDLDELRAAVRPGETSLISVMAVNNEIGTLQPLKEIGQIARGAKALFHTDAAQMIGKLPINVDDICADLISISGHKVYGPKGIGALYVRRKPRVRLEPLFSGGGQERGMRSGTLATSLCVGLGEACAVAEKEMANDTAHISRLSKRLMDAVQKDIPDVALNGCAESRYDGNVNLSFAYVEGESLLMSLKNIAVSSGSACTSASLEPSYVLRAIGVSEDLAHTSIRFGIGRFTTQAEVDYTVELLKLHVGRLRDMSPLWELVQEGVDLSTINWTQDAAHHH
ncbi:pyridoxal phosphate-dependent transferase [Pelagophyceae sp. CCMP2097]|nr:pyridoxal phosphate-dependent transferase [Pelagophyceae sp. CCMP2097]